jgi:two-component system, response regulator YesN
MRKLLVVDDEPDVASSLAEGLPIVDPELEVQVALSGDEARAILDRDPAIEVILCDVRMPGMSGLELLAWARSKGHPARRVVFTAYNAGVIPPEQLALARPHDVVAKPLGLSKLAKVVGRAESRRPRAAATVIH